MDVMATINKNIIFFQLSQMLSSIFIAMLSVIMISVIMLSVAAPNVDKHSEILLNTGWIITQIKLYL
jgi:hypothetical protein